MSNGDSGNGGNGDNKSPFHSNGLTSESGTRAPIAERADGASSRPNAGGLVGETGDGVQYAEIRFAGSRYTRFVKLMKVALVGTALGLAGLVLAWPYFRDVDEFKVSFSSLQFSATDKPGMDNARYVGSDEKNRPFSISADLARLEDGASGAIQLEMPKADLTMEDGSWLMMTAQTGRYIRDDKQLMLSGGVNLFHDTGYEMRVDTLNVDLGRGGAESKDPVFGHGPFGDLHAAGLELSDKGRIVRFTGPAEVTFFPAAFESVDKQTEEGRP